MKMLSLFSRSVSVATRNMRRARRSLRPLWLEAMEPRTLLSGTWSTVDTNPIQGWIGGLATDNAGNLFGISSQTLSEKSGGQWQALAAADANAFFESMAIDGAGNVFIAGSDGPNSDDWTIWEYSPGHSGLSVLEQFAGGATGIASDGAGILYATGYQIATATTTTTVKGKTSSTTTYIKTPIIRKLSPTNGAYTGTTVYQATAGPNDTFSFNTFEDKPNCITVINSGASAGIYVAGFSETNASYASWEVLKSTDAGAHWSVVDLFQYDPTLAKGSAAYAVTGDSAGNVYVAGVGTTQVLTGYTYTKVKGQTVATPTYQNYRHWVTRRSTTGNAGSWTTADDFLPSGSTYADPTAIVADQSGNLYVGGRLGSGHAVIRTSAGGAWSTGDNYSAYGTDGYTALTVDPNGNLFAGTDYFDGSNPVTLIRSLPAAPTHLFATLNPTSPSTSIDLSWSNPGASDSTATVLYRSADGGQTFSLVTTLSPTATSYIDSGLSPNTPYSYYLVNLLNGDGFSNLSPIVQLPTFS